MNHLEIAKVYSQQREQEPNNLALILFGSVARGTSRPDSDLDFLLLHQSPPRKFWEEEVDFLGVKVGTQHLDYAHFRRAVVLQPFNRIILTTAQVMFDKTGNIPIWIAAIGRFFITNPDIKAEWDNHYALYRRSKTELGIKAVNISDLYLQFAVKYRGRVLAEDIPE